MSYTIPASLLLKEGLPKISYLGLDYPATKPFINSIHKESNLVHIYISSISSKTGPRTQYLLSKILLNEALSWGLGDIHSKMRKTNNITDKA